MPGSLFRQNDASVAVPVLNDCSRRRDISPVDRSSATVEHPPSDPSTEPSWKARPWLRLSSLLIAITAVLLVYSQTMAFVWDEGFHLLAAQLIAHGRRPYLDFCFPQTPLNAYWNAAWMSVFGESWRVTHIAATLLTAGSVFLSAEYVLRAFPVPRWRLACAITVAVLAGLNTIVVEFGTIAQAYGMGLFFTVAAFRATIAAVDSKARFPALLAGVLAGAAAASTLLTVAALPVLLIWLFVYGQRDGRWTKACWFAAGAAIPFAPVLWLFAIAPRQVFFNIVQYQAVFRRVKWNSATTHDIDVLSAWLDSGQALSLGLLAILGAWFLARKSGWRREVRGEFYLAGWLAVALAAYIAAAHPTFQRYFIFVAPFASIVAAAGVYFTGTLFSPNGTRTAAAVVCSLMILSLARALFNDRDSVKWNEYEQIASKVDQVTPPSATLYADEQVYFLTQRTPPPGMEFSYAHKLELPLDEQRLFHIISDSRLAEEVKAGRFDTVQSCNEDRMEELNLVNLYRHKADIGDCSIFWGKVVPQHAQPPPAKPTPKP